MFEKTFAYPSSRKSWLAACTRFLLLVLFFAPVLRGNTIYVTTLKDTIGDPAGCSLKDAIFSSRFANNVAIKSYTINSDQTALLPVYVPTSCVAGSGDDTIILPNNATLVLTADYRRCG